MVLQSREVREDWKQGAHEYSKMASKSFWCSPFSLAKPIMHCAPDCKPKLQMQVLSPILFYASEVWGIDCNGKLDKDPAELVQNKFLKWLLGVNKYCNNNASRAETGRFPMTIAAQCRNFKFWLTLTKNEYKLSQIAYNDIKWEENKASWSKKIKSLLDMHIR